MVFIDEDSTSAPPYPLPIILPDVGGWGLLSCDVVLLLYSISEVPVIDPMEPVLPPPRPPPRGVGPAVPPRFCCVACSNMNIISIPNKFSNNPSSKTNST